MIRFGRAMTVLAAATMLMARPQAAGAQVGLSVWLGVGEASDSGTSSFGTEAKQVGVQFALPVFPVAFRADALVLGDGVSLDGLSYNLNVVMRMSLPLFQPYVIAGYGRYALSEDVDDDGWNAGGGVRLGVARLGVFAEVRRHVPLKRTITAFGITL
jgi:hypothetical protein